MRNAKLRIGSASRRPVSVLSACFSYSLYCQDQVVKRIFRDVPFVPQLEKIYRQVIQRNPGESEFHQAVFEVFGSLGQVIRKYPDILEKKSSSASANRNARSSFACRGKTTKVKFTPIAVFASSSMPRWRCNRTPAATPGASSTPGNDLNGASIASFLKVARAMEAFGLV
jgi:hypothetical protein